MTEDLESYIDEELSNAINDVITDLKEINNNLEISTFTELNQELVTEFCNKNNLTVLDEYKPHLTTPFAIGKYILLTIESNELIKKIDNELTSLLDSSKIEWVIYKNFTNQISFNKILDINSEEKPQGLLVKYRIDQETDTVIYTILAGSWGWDLNKYELKNLLEGKISNTILESKTKKNIQFTSSMNENEIIINAGEIKITIQK